MAVTFVGSNAVEATSGTLAWPGGTTAGDHAILLLFGNGAMAHTGSGWTQDVNTAQINALGSNWSAWSKLSLSSGEVSSPFTFSGCDFGGYNVLVYRGGDGITGKTNNGNQGGATNTLTGFAKAATSDRVVSLVIDRSGGGLTVVVPSGFTDRGQTATTFFSVGGADVAASGYTSSANIVWSGLDAGQSSGAGSWEITAAAASYFGLVQPEIGWLLRKPDMIGY